MILVDAHVHIYDCFDLEKFLDAAYSNFQTQAYRLGYGDNFTPILLLAETSKDFWFNRLREYADGRKAHKESAVHKWEFHHTAESISLSVRSGNSKSLIIIAGSQIETEEGLEVLALCTKDRFEDGTPMVELVESIKKVDAIPVIPWGFGKWFGRRGKILADYLSTIQDAEIFLGDNSGRPAFLPFPHHFKIAERYGVHIFPGSDPLPFTTEYNRAGSYGFLLEEKISKTYPAESLKQILMNPKLNVKTYGDLEKPSRFFQNQLKMQIKKRYSKLR